MNSGKAAIAFFDFDGTLTRADSLWHFLWYSQSWQKLLKASLRYSLVYLKMKFGLITNLEAKIAVLGFFFEGWKVEKFQTVCQDFARDKLPKLVKEEALSRLDWHRQQNHHIVLVSASLFSYLAPWCKEQGIDCIATRLLQKDGMVHGLYDQPNCYGSEKAGRIKAAYDLSEYEEIYAYGNSRGDREMLALADHAYFRKLS